MTFTRMDESTAEQWHDIFVETIDAQPQVADHVLAMLRSLVDLTFAFAVDQLVHSLQTATRAEEVGADTEILRSYVRDDVIHVIETHQDFQDRHYYEHLAMDPDLRRNHRDEPWYDLAVTFADEWDQASFDPDYPTKPLAHFELAVRQVFDHPHSL